ncbi:MAG: hypothetical protein B6D58_07685 [candidate division Zixibacteria bacterium 4484_95]|nr:MAG: hypothetical protein B6D58_07685 [candidate division Zixibacteria bacterium 4484_95]
MGSQLDLRYNANIPSEYAKLWNQIAHETHKPFTILIDSLSKQHGKSIDWWVSSPASRNTLTSPLFHYCCCIAFLQELIRKKEPISEIITDSRAFKKIIGDYLVGQGIAAKITLARLPLRQHLKEILRPIYVLFGIPFRHLILFIIAKITKYLRKPFPSNPLTLIDTFVMPNYIEKDRYYPGLMNALSEKEKETVWFVPHLYGFRPWQYRSVIKQLRRSKRNFALKEDYLKFRDYLFAWGHVLRIRTLRIKACLFRGVNISSLVREEMRSFKAISSSYTPLLNYRFARRLKEANIKLRLVVDWFENQNIDKGWNAGFRRYYQETPTIGYQGFAATPHYLCMYPTKVEQKNSVIPHKVTVIGKGLITLARKFCPDLCVTVAPAFRFQQVWQERKHLPTSSEYTVLVALPIMVSDAIHILTMLAHDKANLNNHVRLWIKPHPATPPSVIKKNFGADWPKEFEFVNGEFNDYIEKSNLLISSASSVCLETLAKGIPVIVVGNRHGLTHNPIPENIIEDIWQLCHTPEEIAKAIQFYKNRSQEKIKEHEKIGRRIRQEYFEPVTRDGVRRFLRLREEKYETNY